jgi:membrane associated rhomboid family serine protease
MSEFTKKHIDGIQIGIFAIVFFAIFVAFGVFMFLGPSTNPTEAPAQNFYEMGAATIIFGAALSIIMFRVLIGEDYRDFKRDLLALAHKSK